MEKVVGGNFLLASLAVLTISSGVFNDMLSANVFQEDAFGSGSLAKCEDLSLTADEIHDAVDQAMDEYANSGIPFTDDYGPVILRAGEFLGCTFGSFRDLFSDGFESGDLSAWNPLGFSKGVVFYPNEHYDPRVAYCNRGNSITHPAVYRPRVSDALNRMCHSHDKCYERDCVNSKDCYFRGASSHTHRCDQPFYDYCLNNAFHPYVGDIATCAVALAVSAVFPPGEPDPGEPRCDAEPCQNGTSCLWDGEAGSCGSGAGCIVCSDGFDSCAVPYDPDEYYCEVGQPGPCTGSDPLVPGVITACNDSCNMCSMCASQGPEPQCTFYEGTATRSGHSGPLLATAGASCTGIGGFSIIDEVANHVRFIGVRNEETSGNTSSFDTCNDFSGCFDIVGSGAATRGQSSISAGFSFLGANYTISVSCVP